MISTRSTANWSISSPWSSPHCCPSCRSPFSTTSTRLNPMPRMRGFDCPEPMCMARTPGTPSSVCIKLPARCSSIRSSPTRTTLSEGSRRLPASSRPPTTTTSSSVTLLAACGGMVSDVSARECNIKRSRMPTKMFLIAFHINEYIFSLSGPGRHNASLT